MKQDIKGPQVSRIEALGDTLHDLLQDEKSLISMIEQFKMKISDISADLFKVETSLALLQENIKLVRQDFRQELIDSAWNEK